MKSNFIPSAVRRELSERATIDRTYVQPKDRHNKALIVTISIVIVITAILQVCGLITE